MNSAEIVRYIRQNAVLLAIFAAVLAVGSVGLQGQIRLERRLAEANLRMQDVQTNTAAVGAMSAALHGIDVRVKAVEAKQHQANVRAQGILARLDNAAIGIQRLAATGTGIESRVNGAQIGIQQLIASGAALDARLTRAQIGIEQLAAAGVGMKSRIASAQIGIERLASIVPGLDDRLNKAQIGIQHMLAAGRDSDARINKAQIGIEGLYALTSTVGERANAIQASLGALGKVGLTRGGTNTAIDYSSLKDRAAAVALGDSILAFAFIKDAINGGVGGYRLGDVLATVGHLKYAGLWQNVSCLAVSVGVNDAHEIDGGSEGDRIAAFSLTLDALVSATAGKPIVLNTVIVPAGSDRVSPHLVSLLNDVIRSRASNRVTVNDLASDFATALADDYAGAFSDGIHLRPEKYTVWTPLFERGIQMCKQSSGYSKM